MSGWNHNICDACWLERCRNLGEIGREPTRILSVVPVLIDGEWLECFTRIDPIPICCFCAKECPSGIMVREDPTELTCRGDHEDGQK